MTMRRALTIAALVTLAAAPLNGAEPMAKPSTTEPSGTEQAATGSFEVTMAPQAAPDAAIGRFALDKRFHGPLEATGTGELVTMRTPTEGSAGYVAIERVTGTLAGRTGSFALQHSGLMDRGAPTLHIAIVPDSGTDGLAGISGTLDIAVEGGTHRYTLRYRLPA